MVNRSHQNKEADLARQLEESQRSLRDEFAMAAMQAHALLALVAATMHGKGVTADIQLSPDIVAAGAYSLADAMLKRRENPNGATQQSKTHGCHDCGEERIPRIVAGRLTCPECGSENIVYIEENPNG